VLELLAVVPPTTPLIAILPHDDDWSHIAELTGITPRTLKTCAGSMSVSNAADIFQKEHQVMDSKDG
jgi:hypothetical protein